MVKSTLNSIEVNTYIEIKADDKGKIGYINLSGIHLALNHPKLAKYPRILDILKFFVAIWGKVVKNQFQDAKDAIKNYNKYYLNHFLEKKDIHYRKDIFTIAKRVLLTAKQKKGDAIFIPNQNKLDAFLHFFNIVSMGEELNDILPIEADNSLRNAFNDILKEDLQFEEFVGSSFLKSLEQLNALSIKLIHLDDFQKEILKLVLKAKSNNTSLSELLQLFEKIDKKVPLLKDVSKKALENLLIRENNFKNLISQLQTMAIISHWKQGMEKILKYSEGTSFKDQLIKYASQKEGSLPAECLMQALEELSNDHLPEGMRVDQKEFITKILKDWSWKPDENAGLQDQTSSFLENLKQVVEKILQGERKTQYEKMYLLAEQYGGAQFGRDFQKFYPLSKETPLVPVLESPFANVRIEKNIEIIFKNKTLESKEMTEMEFEKIFPNGQIAAAFLRFRDSSIDKSEKQTVEEFYAWMNGLLTLRSEVLSSKGLVKKIKQAIKNSNLAENLTDNWIKKLFQTGSEVNISDWKDPLVNLISIALDIDEGDLQFGHEIISSVVQHFAEKQGFPNDSNTFCLMLKQNEYLINHILMKCHREARSDRHAESLNSKWIEFFTKGLEGDKNEIQDFIDEFNKPFFNSGINHKELAVLREAVSAGRELAIELKVSLKAVAQGYALYFENQRLQSKPLSMPSSNSLLPFLDNLPARTNWKDEFKRQFKNKDEAKAFLSMISGKKDWQPRIQCEVNLAADLYRAALDSFKKGGYSSSPQALKAVAEGCISYLKYLRDTYQPIIIPNGNLSFLYKSLLPEMLNWKNQMTSPLEKKVVKELEKHKERGPISQKELVNLKQYIQFGNQIIKDGQYSSSVVGIAIRRLVHSLRSEEKSLKSISAEALLRFCFEAYIESQIPESHHAEIAHIIPLFSSITKKEVPLTSKGKSCIQTLIKIIFSPKFGGGRPLDHFRILGKFPEILAAINLSSLEALNSYPFVDILENLFIKESELLFKNLNLREILEALSADPKAISLVIEPVLKSLTGQEELTPSNRKELQTLLDIFSNGNDIQAIIRLVTKFLGTVREAGSIEFDLEISTKMIAEGFLQGFASMKDEDFDLGVSGQESSFVHQLFISLAGQLAEAQKNRKNEYPEGETPPFVGLLNGLANFSLNLISLFSVGQTVGSVILKIPFLESLLKAIISKEIFKVINQEVKSIDSQINILEDLYHLAEDDAQRIISQLIDHENKIKSRKKNKNTLKFLNRILFLNINERNEKLANLKIQKNIFINLSNVSPSLVSLGMSVLKNILSKLEISHYSTLVNYIIKLSQNPNEQVDEKEFCLALKEALIAFLNRIPELTPDLFENIIDGLKKLTDLPKVEIKTNIKLGDLPDEQEVVPYKKKSYKLNINPELGEQFANVFEEKASKEYSITGIFDTKKNIKKVIKENDLINLFKSEFSSIFSCEQITSDQITEIFYLVEVAASIIQDKKFDATQVVKGCKKYAEEFLVRKEKIKAPDWNRTLGWVKESEHLQILPYIGSPIESIKTLAKSHFQDCWSDLPDVKALKQFALNRIIPAFEKAFNNVMLDPNFERQLIKEFILLSELAAGMVLKDGYSVEEVTAASFNYFKSLKEKGESLKFSEVSALDKLTNFFDEEAESHQANLYAYAFDHIVENLAKDLINNGIARALPGSNQAEENLTKKIKLFVNSLRIGQSDLPLNDRGRAALQTILITLMDSNFASGKELLNPLLLQRWTSLLQAAGVDDVSLLNQVEKPIWIKELLIEEAEVRLGKVNLGRLQKAILAKPADCIIEIGHPLIDNLMKGSSTIEKIEAKSAIEDLSTKLAKAPVAASIQKTIISYVGEFAPFKGINFELDVSISQFALSSKNSLKDLRKYLETSDIPSETKAVDLGLAPWFIVKLCNIFSDAQKFRNDALLLTGDAKEKPSTLLATIFDTIGTTIGGPIKLFENFEKGFLGQVIGETASSASKFVQFLVKRDFIKGIIGAVVKIIFYFKEKEFKEKKERLNSLIKSYLLGKKGGDTAQSELNRLKLDLDNLKVGLLSSFRSGEIKFIKDQINALTEGMEGNQEDFLDVLKKEKSEIRDWLVFISSLNEHLSSIVGLISGIVSSVLSRHDLSKHGDFIGYFIDLAVHPEKKFDEKIFITHLLTGLEALLEEIPEFYNDLIPGVLGSIASMQKFSK